MAEEKKESKFKAKAKKIIPWVVGGIGTIGAGILGFKFGKVVTTPTGHEEDNAINRYLLDRVNELESGEKVGVGVMDQDGKETYAELTLCEEKPDWWDSSYEVTTESYFTNLVTSTSTKK